jgi:hypothetical protein
VWCTLHDRIAPQAANGNSPFWCTLDFTALTCEHCASMISLLLLLLSAFDRIQCKEVPL